jgi:hypothetical protein
MVGPGMFKDTSATNLNVILDLEVLLCDIHPCKFWSQPLVNPVLLYALAEAGSGDDECVEVPLAGVRWSEWVIREGTWREMIFRVLGYRLMLFYRSYRTRQGTYTSIDQDGCLWAITRCKLQEMSRPPPDATRGSMPLPLGPPTTSKRADALPFSMKQGDDVVVLDHRVLIQSNRCSTSIDTSRT